jgi:hypothetical protein
VIGFRPTRRFAHLVTCCACGRQGHMFFVYIGRFRYVCAARQACSLRRAAR